MCGWLNHVRPGSLVQLHGDRIMIVAACGDRDEQRPWVPSDLWAHAIDCITLSCLRHRRCTWPRWHL